MESKSFADPGLIAPCGMNCELCYAYQRERNKCLGCNGADERKSAHCANCTIKNCDGIKNSGTNLCWECLKFPCTRLKQLDKRYRLKYGMSMIENLEQIRDSGMDTFLNNQRTKYTCGECGQPLCVHRETCLNCNK
jgi:hypothetical protein